MRVVVLPDVIVCGLCDERCRQFLNLWRDGHLHWVVSRRLLVQYLRLLHRLGVPPDVLQWWGWWFGDAKRTLTVADIDSSGMPRQRYASLARQGKASAVIHSGPQATPSKPFPQTEEGGMGRKDGDGEKTCSDASTNWRDASSETQEDEVPWVRVSDFIAAWPGHKSTQANPPV